MSNPAVPTRSSYEKIFGLLTILVLGIAVFTASNSDQAQQLRSEVDQLKLRIADLQSRVSSLEQRNPVSEKSWLNCLKTQRPSAAPQQFRVALRRLSLVRPSKSRRRHLSRNFPPSA